MPAATKMIKSMYCLWHYEECARYRIAEVLGLENIPSDLFPELSITDRPPATKGGSLRLTPFG
jgi:hypothetical protein